MRVLSLVCVFFPLRFSVLHLIFCVLKYIHNKIFAINLCFVHWHSIPDIKLYMKCKMSR